jgi:hypothetical protein
MENDTSKAIGKAIAGGSSMSIAGIAIAIGTIIGIATTTMMKTAVRSLSESTMRRRMLVFGPAPTVLRVWADTVQELVTIEIALFDSRYNQAAILARVDKCFAEKLAFPGMNQRMGSERGRQIRQRAPRCEEDCGAIHSRD